jgi:hypothetical protein
VNGIFEQLNLIGLCLEVIRLAIVKAPDGAVFWSAVPRADFILES